jgi:hypothetical protein
MKKVIFLVALVVLVAIGYCYFVKQKPNVVVTNFEECGALGNPVMESYPRQCRTADGKLFVEDIGNELEKRDLIRVNNPRPNQLISSPLNISGEAVGGWFFEASFPVKLFDENGTELRAVVAQAESDWMTENFVPFSATLEFETPITTKGILVFKKDNPSDLPQNADQLTMPIRFK